MWLLSFIVIILWSLDNIYIYQWIVACGSGNPPIFMVVLFLTWHSVEYNKGNSPTLSFFCFFYFLVMANNFKPQNFHAITTFTILQMVLFYVFIFTKFISLLSKWRIQAYISAFYFKVTCIYAALRTLSTNLVFCYGIGFDLTLLME